MEKTIEEMYEIVGVGVFDASLPQGEKHLTLIKKAYRQQALRHPDKGEKYRPVSLITKRVRVSSRCCVCRRYFFLFHISKQDQRTSF